MVAVFRRWPPARAARRVLLVAVGIAVWTGLRGAAAAPAGDPVADELALITDAMEARRAAAEHLLLSACTVTWEGVTRDTAPAPGPVKVANVRSLLCVDQGEQRSRQRWTCERTGQTWTGLLEFDWQDATHAERTQLRLTPPRPSATTMRTGEPRGGRPHLFMLGLEGAEDSLLLDSLRPPLALEHQRVLRGDECVVVRSAASELWLRVDAGYAPARYIFHDRARGRLNVTDWWGAASGSPDLPRFKMSRTLLMPEGQRAVLESVSLSRIDHARQGPEPVAAEAPTMLHVPVVPGTDLGGLLTEPGAPAARLGVSPTLVFEQAAKGEIWGLRLADLAADVELEMPLD